MATHAISRSDRRRAITAGAIGNFVEWFDFLAFGALAAVLAPLFFPSGNATASIMSTFATFAVAFVFRPLGGVLFGYIGDRWGRRSSLSATVLVMSGATVVVGLLPTAGSIGAWAAVLLVVARCVQGLGAGGEWSGSVVYLVEFGNQRRRSLFASLTPTGSWLGAMASVALITGLTAALGSAAVSDWAWRIPFLLAAPLGFVGLYMRIRLQDTPAFEELKASKARERNPIGQAFRKHKSAMLVIFVGGAVSAASSYLLIAYMVTYMTNTVGIAKDVALLTNTIAIGVAAVATVTAGLLADRYGRKPIYLGAAALQLVLAVPIFAWIGTGQSFAVLLGQCVLAALNGAMLAPFAVLCVELFPPHVRYAASGIGYSVGAGLLGGISPLVATALVSWTGQSVAPAYYLAASLLLTVVVFSFFVSETLIPGARDAQADPDSSLAAT